jgi:hypothetical protein
MKLLRGAGVCLALGVIALGAGVASAVECVDPGGGGGCFTTIQGAIDAAAVGETINVAAGTYAERLVISQSVVLLGAQAGVDPTPGGARTSPAVESIVDFTTLPRLNPNVEIQINSAVSDVTIDGFTMIGWHNELVADESIIRVGGPGAPTDNDNILIANNIMTGWKPILFKGGGSNNFDVVSNRMVANKNGLVVQFGVDDMTISGNTIAPGTAPAGDAAAMYAGVVQGALIENNVASGFTGSRAWGGSSQNALEFRGNEFKNNNDGISIWGDSTGVTIAENDISDNLRYGINIKAADVLIEKNQLLNNGNSGVNIDDHVNVSSNNVVSCNDITGNTSFGSQVDSVNVPMVVGENNWWGDASGPTHAGNPGGTGDATTDGLDYDPWLGSSAGSATECQPVPLPGPSTGFLALLAVMFVVLLVGLLARRRSPA